MKQKMYEVIRGMLSDLPYLRNSDKDLIWKVWEYEGHIKHGILIEFDYVKCTPPETITRCRRKVQQNHPELQATAGVKKSRDSKSKKGGNFVYNEDINFKGGLFE